MKNLIAELLVKLAQKEEESKELVAQVEALEIVVTALLRQMAKPEQEALIDNVEGALEKARPDSQVPAEDAELLQQYVNTLAPCTYGDFIETAGKYMNGRNHDQLRRLLTFHFKRHSRYNLSSDSLRLIEEQVQKRARILLELS